VIGVAWLGLRVNLLSAAISATAVSSYVFVYTPLKRVTPLCVLIGAVPGALPPMIGWAAGGGTLTLGAWLLFVIMFFWQVAHFATIAWQYRDDYARAGYAVWSVVDPDGEHTSLHLITHTVGLIAASLLPAIYGLAGPVYAVGALTLGLAFLAFGVAFVRRPTRVLARMHVRASITYLPLLLALMLFDKT
jgi:protoheme IX farnesyltransferase